MNKAFLLNMLQEYDLNKGIKRRLYGADSYMQKLESFVHDKLSQYSLTENLRMLELQELYSLLCERKLSLKPLDQYYNRSRLSNSIFHKIIFALAEEKYAGQAQPWQLESRYAYLSLPFSGIRKIFAMAINYFFPRVIRSHSPSVVNFFKWLDPVYFEQVRDSNRVLPIAIAEQDTNTVLTEYCYKDVLGQKNSDRLYLDGLETLDPKLLALTEHGHLVYADDIAELYQQRGTIRNPEGLVPEEINLSTTSIQRMLVTKPLFRNRINKAVQDEYSKIWSNRSAYGHDTLRVFETARNQLPYSANPPMVIYNVRAHLDTLPPVVCNFILGITSYGVSLQRYMSTPDFCQVEMSSVMDDVARKLRTLFSAKALPTVEDTLRIASHKERPATINGLRMR